MTFEMVSSVLLFGVILVAQQNPVVSPPADKSDKYLEYCSLITQIQKSISTGNVSQVKEKLNTVFKQLPADEQKEFLRKIRQFAEKERTQHDITKFLGRLADYFENRQKDKTFIFNDQTFTDWFVNEIESLLEVESTDVGWVMNYGSVALSDVDVWFLTLPFDNQTNIIENLKKLSEKEDVENSITMLLDKFAERLEKIRNEK